MIFEAKSAWRMFSTNAALSPVKGGTVRLKTLAASTRSAFIAERQRANTASPMSVSGTPSSRAAMPVHLPVPFCPAVSRMFSTSAEPSVSLYARMSRVISMR